jgi:hypothetical protein
LVWRVLPVAWQEEALFFSGRGGWFEKLTQKTWRCWMRVAVALRSVPWCLADAWGSRLAGLDGVGAWQSSGRGDLPAIHPFAKTTRFRCLPAPCRVPESPDRGQDQHASLCVAACSCLACQFRLFLIGSFFPLRRKWPRSATAARSPSTRRTTRSALAAWSSTRTTSPVKEKNENSSNKNIQKITSDEPHCNVCVKPN